MWRTGFFLQDTFKIGQRLTVNWGGDTTRFMFRSERHWEGWYDKWENGLANVLLPRIFLPAGATLDSPAMDDVIVYSFLSPRIGMTYDLFGSGKTVLKGSFSRYGESLFTVAIDRLIPIQETFVTFTWWDDNRNGRFDLPAIDRYLAGSYAPYNTDIESLKKQIAPDLKVPYTDELTFGVVQQISEDFSLALTFMDKTSKKHAGGPQLEHRQRQPVVDSLYGNRSRR